MIEATLRREHRDHAVTIGELTIYKDEEPEFVCMTLEPTWANNERNISCIPAGTYNVVPYSSEKYPGTYEVQDVPGRSKILIHKGNFFHNTKGCILVGENIVDLNKDGVIDITNSKVTLRHMKEALGYQTFRLTILEPTS